MKGFAEYESYDAVGLAELITSGQVTSSDLVAAAIDRAERLNPMLNAVVAEHYERARRRAASADSGGPFFGVPFLTKDLANVAGDVATYGSVFFRSYHPETTDEFQLRAERAGLISIGRTNSPEFGLLPTTEPTLHGPTRNPWDLDRSPGGSSGGSAAATAAGIVPMAHSSDGGGSIRIPASACGVFGMKPSRGRMPRYPASPADYLSADLAVSRSVRDSATLLDATHGSVSGSEFHAPTQPTSFAAAVAQDPEVMRIAFADIDFRGHVSSPECRDGVAETADLLDAMGHKVEQAGPRIDGQSMAEAFIVIWESLAESIFTLILTEASKRRAGRLARRLLGDWRAMRLIARIDRSKAGHESFEPFTWALADHSRRHTPAELTAARTELQRVSHVVGEFLETYDSLLTPVVAGPPLRLGEIDQNAGWDELIENLFTYVAFTPIANFTGNPAMSVPTYWTPSGLPIGAHFMGPYGDEARMLSLAGQLERARPWFDRRPPVSR